MSFEVATQNDILDTYFVSASANRWLSLHTSSPGRYADIGTELIGFGNGYERQEITGWSAASGGSTSITSNLVFYGLEAVRITHWAVWDSKIGGEMLWFGAFDSVLTPPDGGGLEITGLDLTFGSEGETSPAPDPLSFGNTTEHRYDHGSVGSNFSSTQDLALPSGAAAGDLLLLYVSTFQMPTVTVNTSGYTQQISAGSGNDEMRVYTKKLTSTDISSGVVNYTVQNSATAGVRQHCAATIVAKGGYQNIAESATDYKIDPGSAMTGALAGTGTLAVAYAAMHDFTGGTNSFAFSNPNDTFSEKFDATNINGVTHAMAVADGPANGTTTVTFGYGSNRRTHLVVIGLT